MNKNKRRRLYIRLTLILGVLASFVLACDPPDTPNDQVKYKVTFDTDGGSPAPAEQTVVSGAKATKPADNLTKANADPNKANLVFDDWYKVANVGDAVGATPYNFDAEVTGDIILKAGWLAPQTVTFLEEAGAKVLGTVTVGNGKPAKEPAADSEIVTKAIEAKVATGSDKYRVGGWKLVADAGAELASGTAYDFTPPVTTPIFLRPVLVQVFTVTYDIDDGTGTAPAAGDVDAGGTISTAPDPAPTKDHYTFAGWHVREADGSLGAAFTFGAAGTGTPVNGDVTLKAGWDAVTYTATFVAGGGTQSDPVTVNLATQSKAYTASLVFARPVPDPTLADNKFVDWYKVGDAGDVVGATPYNFSEAVTGNIILKAKWVARPADKAALQALIKVRLTADPTGKNLADIDTSLITDMAGLFKSLDDKGNIVYNGVFNGNIGGWDVSQVTDMSHMFEGNQAFNQDLSNWDVSKVANMNSMFWGARAFNQDLSNWDVSKVTNMSYMFYRADVFNGNISNWTVSAVTNMKYMFYNTRAFNQDLSGWDVSKVTNMAAMFYNTAFNRDLNNWNVSKVTDMNQMFAYAYIFNGNISGWNVSKVTNMNSMFNGAAKFNQDISGWTVTAVTEHGGAFTGSGIENDPAKQPKFAP